MWSSPRAPELRLDRGFTEVAANMFLRSFDETVTFAGLKEGDGLSLNLTDSAPVETANLNRLTGQSRPIPPMSGLAYRGTRGGLSHYQTGPDQMGPQESQFVQPPRATLPLPEGMAALEIPPQLSKKSWEALKAWADLMINLSQPMPDHLKGRTGSNLNERAASGMNDADQEE